MSKREKEKEREFSEEELSEEETSRGSPPKERMRRRVSPPKEQKLSSVALRRASKRFRPRTEVERDELEGCGGVSITGPVPGQRNKLFVRLEGVTRIMEIKNGYNPTESDVAVRIIQPFISATTTVVPETPGCQNLGGRYGVIPQYQDQLSDIPTVFDVREAVVIMFELLTAVDFLHKNGIVHSNITRETIFIKKDNATGEYIVKLGGFSECVYCNPDIGRYLNKPVENRTYRPPEHTTCKGFYTYGYYTDIWQLGLIFIYILLPRRSIKTMDEISSDILTNYDPLYRRLRISLLLDELGENKEPLVDVIDHMLRLNPLERFVPEDLSKFPAFRGVLQIIKNIAESNGLAQGVWSLPAEAVNISGIGSPINKFVEYVLSEEEEILLETFFLALDLFIRTLPAESSDVVDNRTPACLQLARKLVEKANTEVVIPGETAIANYLKGALYNRNIYTEAQGPLQLLFAFNEIMKNPNSYYALLNAALRPQEEGTGEDMRRDTYTFGVFYEKWEAKYKRV
jgi:hypothetical protein